MMASELAYAIAPSLADPEGSSPFLAAVRWIEGVALGATATSIALIAVATIGFLMLAGRLPIRRSATVILGCFILFGAPVIAQGILGLAQSSATATAPPREPIATAPIALPTAKPTPAYDPYAGAAVPPR